jgi:hypothetical protein
MATATVTIPSLKVKSWEHGIGGAHVDEPNISPLDWNFNNCPVVREGFFPTS